MGTQSAVERHVEVVFGKPFEKIAIGYDGENLASVVTMDCSTVADKYPGAAYTVLFSRGKEEPYIAVPSMTADPAHRLSYTLTSTETAVPGALRMEVQARQGGTLLKSFVFYFVILKSLDAPAQPPPPPEPGWVVEVKEAATQAETAAKEAADILAEILGLGGSSGAALTADRLATARELQVSGAVYGRVMFDGSQDVDIVTMTGDIVLTNEEIEEALQ